MDKDKNLLLKELFEKWSGEELTSINALPQSGSYREYYRINGETKTVIGVYNQDKDENTAFLEFTKHFLSNKLPVPQLLAENQGECIYLLEDLGDITLFSFLTDKRKSSEFPEELLSIYKKVIDLLPEFQINAGRTLDYSVCYPRANFDKQSMMWDLNYFKYYFLKLAQISFDEQALESDFHTFTDYLLTADCNYFLYRDCQSRNIMLKNGSPYFIDYQGGRKGALHYDLASLLYDAKADLPQHIRTELLHYYISKVKHLININESDFIQMFFGYVLIRIMQAMGAYGFRGFYEKKEHFLKSIPYAMDNLSWLLNTVAFPIKIPHLLSALTKVTKSEKLRKFGEPKKHEYKLEINLNSFSYKKQIPPDYSGNGGGFVFDCRGIHNPGRYSQYRLLTGKDEEVIKFLKEESDIDSFLENIINLIHPTINVYLNRKFTNLMISFGCTGGQHRSVYCAEKLSAYLSAIKDVKVNLHHIELEK